MGMPACTITSQTAHGGVVMVGYPTVLIGMMPASRIGDMHVCPMVTGVVPHVGGPFVLGSPTVLVGMMPQSRVTDQLVCVGPPDIAVMGVTTVLVGMAGAGGVVSMSAGLQMAGVPVPMQPAPQPALQATLQPDGTVATAATTGPGLPPIFLQQSGWPDLPAENTATFQSVQPVTIPRGATLYAPCGSGQIGPGNYWTTAAPERSVNSSVASEDSHSTSADAIAVLSITHPDGLKAWAGMAAGGDPGKVQVWAHAANSGAQAIQKFSMQGRV